MLVWSFNRILQREERIDPAFDMMTYARYTELLSKRIQRTISPTDLDEIGRYESAQPELCPKCNARVRSQFMPSQIVHDVEQCEGKRPGTN